MKRHHLFPVVQHLARLSVIIGCYLGYHFWYHLSLSKGTINSALFAVIYVLNPARPECLPAVLTLCTFSLLLIYGGVRIVRRIESRDMQKLQATAKPQQMAAGDLRNSVEAG